MTKIVYIFRKPWENRSVERLFSWIADSLDSSIDVMKVFLPARGGRSLIGVLRNVIYAASIRGDIGHVTGDVHYVIPFLQTQVSILTIHDCYLLERKTGLEYLVLWMFWYYIPMKLATEVTVISEFTLRSLERHRCLGKRRVTVIRNCVDESFFRLKSKAWERRPVVLQVGTRENKNLENHARALARCDIILRIVGSLTDTQKCELDNLELCYSCSGYVRDDEVLEEYAACDIVLFASLYEGFGLPVIEAQAAGKPVITSNIAPMCELAGRGALLVCPTDIAEIQSAVSALISDESLRKRLVAEGRLNANNYRPVVVQTEWAILYGRLRLGMRRRVV